MKKLKAFLEERGEWESFKYNLTNFNKTPHPFNPQPYHTAIIRAFIWHKTSSWMKWLLIHKSWNRHLARRPGK